MIVLAIRFLAELAGVASLAYWGFVSFEGPAGLVAGIGAPAALVVAWALVVAPKADNPLPPQLRVLLGTALLLVAAGALVAAGLPELGTAFAIVVLLDQIAILVLHPSMPANASDRRS